MPQNPEQPSPPSAPTDEHPREDIQETQMLRPFSQCRRTLMVLAGFGLLAAFIWLVPLQAGPLTGDTDPARVKVGLGIFACIAFLWMTEAMPLAATALLVPVLAVLFRVSDMKSALTAFSDPLIFVFLGGFALASAMSCQGLDRWIAQSIVRLGRGRFIPVACLLFCGTAFLSMWMSNTATTAMMIPLALGILRHLQDHSEAVRNRTFLLLGLAYSASIGGLGTMIGSPPNGIAATRLGLSFTDWLKFGIPAVLVLMPALIGLLYLIFKPSRGLRIHRTTERITFNPQRRTTLAIFGCTAACWVFGGALGPWLGVEKSFDTLVALVAIFALLFFRVVRWRDIHQTTDWGVLLLFGGGIALSAVLQETGASLFLARLLTGAADAWPLVFVVAAVVTFVIFLTELSSNTAIAALFVPIFYSVAGEMGVAPMVLIAPLALAASCAFMMPVATPPNAIVFGTGLVTQRSMMHAGLVLNLVFAVILTTLSMFLL